MSERKGWSINQAVAICLSILLIHLAVYIYGTSKITALTMRVEGKTFRVSMDLCSIFGHEIVNGTEADWRRISMKGDLRKNFEIGKVYFIVCRGHHLKEVIEVT